MPPTWLIGQADRFQSMASQFQSGGQRFSVGQVLAWMGAIACVVAVGLIARAIFKWRQRLSANSPQGLLAELCGAHNLAWKDRRLLSQLACSRQLEHPAKLFLEPDLFDPATFSQKLAPHRAELLKLRDRIFGKRLEKRETAE